MDIELFKKINKMPENKIHPKVILLRDNIMLKSEKQLLESWTQGFIDKDKKLVRQFQETFHSSFWEIFLYKLFSSKGFEIDQTHQVPDFVIKSPYEFYVEAVVANIKDNGRQESERTLEDLMSMMTPPYLQEDFNYFLDEAIIRIASAMRCKQNKISQYMQNSWIQNDKPFLLAVASYDQINYGREFIYSMLALLYGFYYLSDSQTYVKRKSVYKRDTGSEIPISLFDMEEYKTVSAVIFTCTLTIGKLTSLCISNGLNSFNKVYNLREGGEIGRYQLQEVCDSNPECLEDGVFIFHNPNAVIPLSEEIFGKTAVTQYFVEEGELMVLGNLTPLVARMNISSLCDPLYKPLIYEMVRKNNKLSMEEFYE